MQERLFDQATTDDEDEDWYSPDHDPYEEVRLSGARLAKEFRIDRDRATDMVLSFGSEDAARRALTQRWLLGELESKAA